MTQAHDGLTPTQRLETLVNDLEHYIREALDILDSGEYLELNGLDEQVADLCRQVTEVPLADAKDFQPRLSGVIKQLDVLQTIMVEHRNRVEEQLQGLDTNKRANQAYAKSDTMIPKPKAD